MEALEIIHTIIRVVLIILIIFIERKKPGEALLWVIFVFVFPLIGGIFYFAFGSTVGIKITYFLRSQKAHDTYLQAISKQLQQLKDGSLLKGFSPDEARLATFNLNYCEGGIGFKNTVDIITDGLDKFERLFEDIACAAHHIHIAYYGIHDDRIGRKLMFALTEKAEQGVRVKVICDSIGSLGVKTSLFGPLIKAGGEVKTIKPALTHFRYHRKIVVVDGRLGYTGGMNIGSKYAHEHPHKTPWRDTQVRIVGDSVALLQYYFLYDWLFASGGVMPKDYFGSEAQLFPPSESEGALPCQIVGSGVETDNQPIKLSYLNMLSLARRKIVLQSPYFIPSPSLFECLKVALSSGVEVQLITSNMRANFFLDPVTRYFIAQLVPLGLKVFNYNGYVHAKTVRVDDTITCIGSVNIDIRSLEVDDELCAFFYSKEFAERYDAVLAEDLARSTEMDYQALTTRSLFKRAEERFFLLFSPLM